MAIKINGPLNIGTSGGGFQQRSVASYFTTASSLTYIHIKTTLPQQSYSMPMFEIIGYNYVTSLPIRMAFVIYTYSYLISNYQNTAYTGLTGSGVYISSDGYVCLRMYAADTYYCGFTVDVHAVAGNGAQATYGVYAITANNNSGNAY
jgi:hypothetical protein